MGWRVSNNRIGKTLRYGFIHGYLNNSGVIQTLPEPLMGLIPPRWVLGFEIGLDQYPQGLFKPFLDG